VTDDNGGWSDSTKWLTGIAASIIVALVVFSATRDGGWLNPSPTTTTTTTLAPAPAISISQFQVAFPAVSTENVLATFTVTNEGTAVARGCVLHGDVSPIGDEFSVEAHSSTTFTWGVRTYGQSGSIQLSATAVCENATSATEVRQVVVI
jgi:hypothetical protein